MIIWILRHLDLCSIHADASQPSSVHVCLDPQVGSLHEAGKTIQGYSLLVMLQLVDWKASP
jgi:hypothetical protein